MYSSTAVLQCRILLIDDSNDTLLYHGTAVYGVKGEKFNIQLQLYNTAILLAEYTLRSPTYLSRYAGVRVY